MSLYIYTYTFTHVEMDTKALFSQVKDPSAEYTSERAQVFLDSPWP